LDKKSIIQRINRKVTKVEVFTLNGSKLTTVEHPLGEKIIKFDLMGKGTAPAIIVCHAADGSYITKKLR